MSTKSRERKKLSRHIKTERNQQFNEKALNFINAIFSFEDKEIPKFTSNDEVLKVYSETQNRINNELMWHRNRPVTEIRLNAFKYFSDMGLLPKSTKIILESFA